MKKPIKVTLDLSYSVDASRAFGYAHQVGVEIRNITAKYRGMVYWYDNRLIIYFNDISQLEAWLSLCLENPEGVFPIDLSHIKIKYPKKSI